MAITQSPFAPRLNTTQNGETYVDNLTNRYLIKPKSVSGIGGFIFDYEGEDNVAFHSEITDHWNEANVAIQDHVARSPVHISLKGFVGELVYRPPSGILGAVATIQNRLTTVPAYLGKYTPGATKNIQQAIGKAQSIVSQVNQAVARVKNVVGLFGLAAPSLSFQEQAFNKLVSLWETNQVMIVETPWGIFGDMIIEDLIFVQDDTTRQWSDITVKLKGIRFAATQVTLVDSKSGRAVYQAQNQNNQGDTKGSPVQTSILRGFFPTL